MSETQHFAYRRWATGAGAVTIRFTALRPFTFTPLLLLIENGQPTRIPVTGRAGEYTAELSDAQVQRLTASAADTGTTYLLLTANAQYRPGAPNREWKWGMAIKRGTTPLPCFDGENQPIQPGHSGLIESPVHTFPAGQPREFDIWTISLS